MMGLRSQSLQTHAWSLKHYSYRKDSVVKTSNHVNVISEAGLLDKPFSDNAWKVQGCSM